MKYLKILALAAVAASVCMAVPVSAPATTVTSPSGTTYTSLIKAEAESIIRFKTAVGTIECKESNIELRVEAHGGSTTASGKLSLLTFSGCSGGTATTPVAKSGSMELHGTSTTGSGTITSTGAEIIFHNTPMGTCTFLSANNDIGVVTGSNITPGNATIDVNGVLKVSGLNPFCGTTVTWEGNYRITTPSALEVH